MRADACACLVRGACPCVGRPLAAGDRTATRPPGDHRPEKVGIPVTGN
jgi:hypothetical protein